MNEWEISNEITITVNGETGETAEPEDKLADVVKRLAQARGLRTVSVLVNGIPANPSQGAQTLAQLSADSIEIRTKDQRA